MTTKFSLDTLRSVTGWGKAAVRDFAQQLAVVDIDRPSSRTWLVPALRERLGLRFALSYRAGRHSAGWDLDFFTVDGISPARVQKKLEKLVRPGNWAAYDPLHPDPAQQNTVVRILDIIHPEKYEQMGTHDALRDLGLRGEEIDETRALICDRGLLLAWIGGSHVGRLPASAHHFFEQLIPHIRRRLIAERALAAHELLDRGLEAAMEEIEREAFLTDTRGVVQYANGKARAAPLSELRALAEEVRHAGEPGRSFRATHIRSAGCGDHYLLVRRRPNEAELLERAAREWRLTPRQAEVLTCIVHGDANKTIAERLKCAPRTVEVHVSALFSKARVANRTALVSRVLGG